MQKAISKINRLLNTQENSVYSAAILGSEFYIKQNEHFNLMEQACRFAVENVHLEDLEDRKLAIDIGSKCFYCLFGPGKRTLVACLIKKGSPVRKSIHRLMRSILDDLEVDVRLSKIVRYDPLQQK